MKYLILPLVIYSSFAFAQHPEPFGKLDSAEMTEVNQALQMLRQNLPAPICGVASFSIHGSKALRKIIYAIKEETGKSYSASALPTGTSAHVCVILTENK